MGGSKQERTGSEAERAEQAEAAEAAEKKDKVLHTRISPSLDREIKRKARGLGMSVSTVVRNVLLNTFDLVEDIVSDSTHLALTIAGEDEEKPPSASTARRAAERSAGGTVGDAAIAAGEILGWQELVLNLNAVCDHCNEILAKGSRAATALRDAPGPRTIICDSCLAAVGDGGGEQSGGSQ